ncbi:hypothetical protein KUTeg_015402 [Tegillarca granosa]|uniref:EF-hand domain-containing protein n=1 Tax=Tegillarca granosa TaxID=220873 RepID=A0ABQ9EVI7_TEGGR|nr:hypothetical protein KUTeg_015402 [Tegillarca granosa]
MLKSVHMLRLHECIFKPPKKHAEVSDCPQHCPSYVYICKVERSTGTTYGIPCAFTMYDLDRDGFVTMTELDSVLASVMKNHTIKATFYMMDRNDDAVIDSDEFGDGPLARRNCPQGRTEGQ